MDAHMVRRAIGDIRAVWSGASPMTAARWLTCLMVHLPECVKLRSLIPADQIWEKTGASFEMSGGTVSLPASYVAGAREMYCRNVYLRTGLTMPSGGWVVDLGANRGLFSVWAAVSGAQAIAVEAQQDFAPLIRALAAHNDVADRVFVEVALASGTVASGSAIGVLADDERWETASHGGAATRPVDVSVSQLMSAYRLERVGMLKMDIEGGEFAVFAEGENLNWLYSVDQMALEIHRQFGDPVSMVGRILDFGFTAEFCDNDGNRVPARSEHLEYAYFKR